MRRVFRLMGAESKTLKEKITKSHQVTSHKTTMQVGETGGSCHILCFILF
jgi:hypothetical protein